MHNYHNGTLGTPFSVKQHKIKHRPLSHTGKLACKVLEPLQEWPVKTFGQLQQELNKTIVNFENMSPREALVSDKIHYFKTLAATYKNSKRLLFEFSDPSDSQQWQELGLDGLVEELKFILRSYDLHYDNRGNARVSTLIESRWALHVYNLFMYHPTDPTLIAQAVHDLATFFPFDIHPEQISLSFWSEIKAAMEYGQLGDLCSKDTGLMSLGLPFNQYCKKAVSTIFNSLREHRCFTNRGREDLPDRMTKMRKKSAFNCTAGIASGSTAQLLPELTGQRPKTACCPGKSAYKREYSEAGTDNFFMERNIPYVSGASGTLSYILAAHLHNDRFCQRSMELIVLYHATHLIICAHHSLLEIIAVAQLVGLFNYLPNILDSKAEANFYLDFCSVASTELGQRYGLPSLNNTKLIMTTI